MSERVDEPRRRRIVVAIDTSPSSLLACEAAAALAVATAAELVGVFVEDRELLQSAALPLTREIGTFSAQVRPLGVTDLESQLRVRAQQAQQALARIAQHARARWSFRVVRGSVPGELAAAAAGADLISVGRVGWSFAGRRHVGSTVRALARRGEGRYLVTPPGRAPEGPVRVVVERDTPINTVLDAGALLAQRSQRALEVAVLATDDAEAEALAAAVRDELTARGADATVAMARSMSQATGGTRGVVVMSPSGTSFTADALADIDVPVLLVR